MSDPAPKEPDRKRPDDGDPLAVTPERMREMARATVELLAEDEAGLRARPVVRRASPEELSERIGGTPPERGRPFEQVLEELRVDVLPFGSRVGHPAYFAYIPGNSTFPGALGDLIAGELNIEASNWMDSSAATQLELTVLRWFAEWIGYPAEAEGILVSGGSAANLTALACARESLVGPMRDDLVVYASDQGHSSVARAARALGFRPEQLRVLPVDDEFRMRPDALEGAIAADRDAGRTPLIVCASAGSTNTGAIDPLGALADVCRANGAWLHVDGAYGGFAALSERGKRLLAGIERADSVTLDPHKWLYQPYECGCVLVREGGLLEDAFRITPYYLKDARGAEVDFADRGLQLSRMARSLKLWLSIQTFGVGAFREAIERTLDLAELAEHLVRETEELELLRPARLGIVCFRRRFGHDRSEAETEALNRRLVSALEQSGEGLVSSTRLLGRYAIRLCVLNHTSTERDVRHVLEWLERATVDEQVRAAATLDLQEPTADPHHPLVVGGAPADRVEPAELRTLEALAGLDDNQIELLAETARTVEVEEGETITTRWGGGRDFYLILKGEARAEVNGEVVRTMSAGDFFGELAALDWGAGYGYTRLATVVATSPARLVVVPPDVFNRLVREVPDFERRIGEAVRERLPRS
jgi:glutamate/tyrosine decarboxylase-like PLP-dependent enzyme